MLVTQETIVIRFKSCYYRLLSIICLILILLSIVGCEINTNNLQLILEDKYEASFDGKINKILYLNNSYYFHSIDNSLIYIFTNNFQLVKKIILPFESKNQHITNINDTLVVINEANNHIYLFNPNLELIDNWNYTEKIPTIFTFDGISDDRIIVTSYESNNLGLIIYDLHLNKSFNKIIGSEVGNQFWDIKTIQVANNQILIGFPFSGLVEIISTNFENIISQSYGTELLGVKLPNKLNQDNSKIKPPSLGFLSINLIEDKLIYLNPKIDEDFQTVNVSTIGGKHLAKSYLDGSFDRLFIANDKIIGINKHTNTIDVFGINHLD